MVDHGVLAVPKALITKVLVEQGGCLCRLVLGALVHSDLMGSVLKWGYERGAEGDLGTLFPKNVSSYEIVSPLITVHQDPTANSSTRGTDCPHVS